MTPLNYTKIDELFGAPLDTVGIPHVPFKLKTWHVVGGLLVTGLAIYGGYCVYKNLEEKLYPEGKAKNRFR